MTIKIEIIKTQSGWNYRNSESRKLVGTIKECANKPKVHFWECNTNYAFTDKDKAHNGLQKELTKQANYLGVDIEFTNI